MGTKAVRGTDPALVILYRHLRETYKKRRIDVPEVSIDIECEFMYRSANAYERLGCPALALRIIQKSLLETTDIYDLASEPVMEEETRSSPPAPALGVNAITAFDWGEPVSSQKPLADTSPSVIDWSQPVSSQMAPTLSSSSYDWGGPVSSQPQTTNNNTTSSGFDWSEPVSQKPTTNTASAFDLVEPVSTSNGNTAIDWGELVSTIKMDDDYEAVKSSLGGALEDEPSLTVESDDNDLRNNIANIPESPRRPSKKIVVNAKSLRRFQIQKKHIFLYKWQLFMRIVQV